MSTLTLALDASTSVGTIAVLRDSSIVAEGEALMRGEREERLMPAICATLASAGCIVQDVGRVVCGAGQTCAYLFSSPGRILACADGRDRRGTSSQSP